MRSSFLKYGIIGALAIATSSPWGLAHAALPEATQSAVSDAQAASVRVQAIVDEELLAPWLLDLEHATATAATDLRGKRLARYAAKLYIVERRLVSHIETLAEHIVLSDETFDSLRLQLLPLLGRIQWNYPSVLEAMRQRANRANPGRSGTTEVNRIERYVSTSGGGTLIATDVYEPTYLTEKRLTHDEKAEAYSRIKQTFLEKNGIDTPLHRPLDLVIAERGSGHIFEWVVMPTEEVRATADGKHALMAEGGGVLAAGGGRVWRRHRADGQVEAYMALISNWTGTYQADMSSTTKFVPHLGRAAGVDPSMVVLTPTMPMSPRAFENILVADGATKAKARRTGLQLVQHANRLATQDRERVKGAFKAAGIPINH